MENSSQQNRKNSVGMDKIIQLDKINLKKILFKLINAQNQIDYLS